MQDMCCVYGIGAFVHWSYEYKKDISKYMPVYCIILIFKTFSFSYKKKL